MKISEKIKLLSELKRLAKEVKTQSLSGLALIKSGKKIKEIRALLGFGKELTQAPETTQVVGEIQPLQIPENATPDERYQLAQTWLKNHIQGATITTVDGKRVVFNRKLSTAHLSHNARNDGRGLIAKCIPFIADVFQTGKFVERQALTKPRTDGKVAFHRYEKWVKIDSFNVLLEAKACEFADGRLEALGDVVAYNLKAEHLSSNPSSAMDNVSASNADELTVAHSPKEQEKVVTRTPSNLSPVMDNALGESLSPPTDKHTLISDSTQADKEKIANNSFQSIGNVINDSVQAENALLTILEITDLNGNSVTFNEEVLPQEADAGEINPKTLDKSLNLPDEPNRNALTKAVFQWLKDNVQGKTITAVDGKKIRFNRKNSVEHLTHDSRFSDVAAYAIPYVVDVFKSGVALGREESYKDRNDRFVAFHTYEKWVELTQLKVKVLLEAKAGETANGQFETEPDLIAYHQKVKAESTVLLGSELNNEQERGVNNQSKTAEIAFPGIEQTIQDSSQASNSEVSGLCDNATLMFDSIQAENAFVVIKAVIDLSGNPITLDEELNIQKASAQTDGAVFFDEEMIAKGRQKANNQAYDVLKQVFDGSLAIDEVNDIQKSLLAKYTGNGAGMKNNLTGKVGSQYEYYTPPVMAKAMWDLLASAGFTGGKVLDPCAGTGIFSSQAPKNALIDSVELDQTSGTINKILFNDDRHTVQISPFEAVAAATDDEQYDAVITNVPFGNKSDRGGNEKLDSRYQNDDLDSYFIKRSLDKLRPNGLAVFMASTRIITGTKHLKVRQAISQKAEFIGAYRLPNKVFANAGADVMTDVMVFKKHSREQLALIETVSATHFEQLEKANVMWLPFISGKYFQSHPANVLGTATRQKKAIRGVVREVDALNSDLSLPQIAKLMKNLGGSRIDWAVLDNAADNSVTISYAEGDTLYFGGILKQYQNGEWVNAETANAQHEVDGLIDELNRYNDAIAVIEQKMDLDYALSIAQQLQARGVLPRENLIAMLFRMGAVDKEHLLAGVVAVAYDEIMQHTENGDNLLERYPAFSELAQSYTVAKTKAPAYLDSTLKAAFASTKTAVFDLKTNAYRNSWQGIAALPQRNLDELSPVARYELALYQKGAEIGMNGGVPLAQWQSLFPEIDLDTAEEWCLSLDGTKVIRAEDYFVGNVGEFDRLLDEAIHNATDDNVRAKLIRQKNAAEKRILSADVSKMDFPINSPLVSIEKKVSWLNRFLTQTTEGEAGAFEVVDGVKIAFRKSKKHSETENKLYGSLANFINNNTFSLGGVKKEFRDDQDYKDAMKLELSNLIKKVNNQFSTYTRHNKHWLAEVDERVNARKNLNFQRVENTEMIQVEGINDSFQPRGHQSAFVRSQVRKFGGICGFDVGFGKTFSALLAVQHLQSIGAKRKTLFVVPNATLTNWRKEALAIFKPDVFNRCLFVGLAESDGEFKYQSKIVEQDLVRVLDNQHDKIYMTEETFEGISLKGETIGGYLDYLNALDPSLNDEVSSAKGAESAKSKKADLQSMIESGMRYGQYLENMGIDSLVIDEAHHYKNARTGKYGGFVKWLNPPQATSSASNVMAKNWYIRGLSAKGDGTLLLTATPITNSPMEIYSMLALSVGEKRVQEMLGVSSPDEFLQTFCDVDYREEMNASNRMEETQLFVGLRNLTLLRKAFNEVIDVRNVENTPEMGLVVPNAVEMLSDVEIPDTMMSEINKIKDIYEAARELEDGGVVDSSRRALVVDAANANGETTALLAHPFNFINKVSALLLDKDLADYTTSYTFAEDQRDIAEKVLAEFNKKSRKDTRTNTINVKEAYLQKKEVKTNSDGDISSIKYIVEVKAEISDNRISFNSVDYGIQSQFIALCEKHGLGLNVSLSPKMAAMVENINAEKAMPKSVGAKNANIAKQIVFCDQLGAHHKIKQAISSRCGVSANRIQILNGASVTVDEMQTVQDGFNAFGDENKYEIIIANKKAEVGINLQKGCQAIHHLTVGWTPDSLQQRNGRGVRQGNPLSEVNVYQYDVDGTFDKYRRRLLENKGNWINSLMYSDSEKIAILDEENSLSKQQMNALAGAMGDKKKIAELEEQFKAINAEARQGGHRSALVREIENLAVVNAQQQEVERFADYWDNEVVRDLLTLLNVAGDRADKVQSLYYRAQSSPDDKVLQERYQEAKAKLDKQWQIACARPHIANILQTLDLKWDTQTSPKVGFYAGDEHAFLSLRNQLKALSAEHGQNPASKHYQAWQDEMASRSAIVQAVKNRIDELAEKAGEDPQSLADLYKGNYILLSKKNNALLRKGTLFRTKEGWWCCDRLYSVAGTTTAVCYALEAESGEMLNYANGAYQLNLTEFTANNRILEIATADSMIAHGLYRKMAQKDSENLENTRNLWSYAIPAVRAYVVGETETPIEHETATVDDVFIVPNEVLMAISNRASGQFLAKFYQERGIVFKNGQWHKSYFSPTVYLALKQDKISSTGLLRFFFENGLAIPDEITDYFGEFVDFGFWSGKRKINVDSLLQTLAKGGDTWAVLTQFVVSNHLLEPKAAQAFEAYGKTSYTSSNLNFLFDYLAGFARMHYSQ